MTPPARRTTLVFFFLGACFAQNQTPPNFVRDYCVKVANGKGAEFSAYTHDVAVKLIQGRVDSGESMWGGIARVVSPAGTTARCDYHIVYGYSGKLPEPPSDASTEAAMRRGGLTMTAAELAAKRDALSRLVSVEVMRGVDGVPLASMGKGTYVRLNHYKVRSGQRTADWLDLERNTWKPLVAADNADGHSSGWGVWVITMPGGDGIWSNGLTVDLFPDWEALMRGIPLNQLWPKVHGNRSRAEWSDRLSTICERPLIEIARFVEYVSPKSAGTGGNN
jgi:hypothetical protein